MAVERKHGLLQVMQRMLGMLDDIVNLSSPNKPDLNVGKLN